MPICYITYIEWAEKHKVLKLTQEDVEVKHLNRYITTKEFELVIKESSTKKIPPPKCLTGEFSQNDYNKKKRQVIVWQERGKIGAFIYAWDYKWSQLLWKTCWQFFKLL